MKGRKTKQESRADELRRRLLAWKQMPESVRPSLRALAAETGASHQLLSFYLKDLQDWQARDRYLRAKKNTLEKAERIRAQAAAENREMTIRECCEVIIVPGVLDQIEEMRQKAKRGPLHSAEFKIIELWAKNGFPGAQELLQRREQIGVKKRKRFVQIVKETPRQEGEQPGDWVRRIWDECEKYETNCPQVLSVEHLERLTRSVKQNLPLGCGPKAKSFRSVEGSTGNSTKVEGRRTDAVV